MRLDFDSINKDIKVLPGTSKLKILANDRPKIVNSQLIEKGNGVEVQHGSDELKFNQPNKIKKDYLGSYSFLIKESFDDIVKKPAVYLILLIAIPIFLGTLWPRKKASLVAGISIGIIFIAILSLLSWPQIFNNSSLGFFEKMIITILSIVSGVFIFIYIGSIGSLFSFLSSTVFRKINRIQNLQTLLNRIDIHTSILFSLVIILLSLIIHVLINIFISSSFLLLLIFIITFYIMLKI